MSIQDARALTIETQEYLRQQAIRLRQQGQSMTAIAVFLGVHRNTVSRWWQQYQDGGAATLRQHLRGRAVGEQRRLSASDESEIQDVMLKHFPEALGIDSALWTRSAVQALIQQRCGVVLPLRTVGEYLKRWGFTPQKPLKRAYEQNPKAVEEWLETTYPQIVKRAETEQAEIAWGDESGLKSDDQVGRGYAPMGKTPEIHLSQTQNVRLNFIASVSNQGTVRFMLYTSTLTTEVFIRFLERLIKNRSKKLFFIVDRYRVHQSKRVQQWLADHQQQIELFYLPAYSPHLNPVEYLNGDVKQGVHSKPPTRSLKQLQKRAFSHLRMLQKLPERVQSYFEHPCIAYAAQEMQPI